MRWSRKYVVCKCCCCVLSRYFDIENCWRDFFTTKDLVNIQLIATHDIQSVMKKHRTFLGCVLLLWNYDQCMCTMQAFVYSFSQSCLCFSGLQWCAPSSTSSAMKRLNTWQALTWLMVDSTGSWISDGTLFLSERWIDERGTEHFPSGTQRKYSFLHTLTHTDTVNDALVCCFCSRLQRKHSWLNFFARACHFVCSYV